MTKQDLFKISGDIRLTERCATEDCGGQVTHRLEKDGIGSYYCSGCAQKIERLLKPNCYKCANRRNVSRDAHSQCVAIHRGASPTFSQHGIDMGWAMWPLNFDPAWLLSCPLFKKTKETA